ncbi:MAG TPA: methylmalonyl-CoA epimerase [Candidatus Polarisedimenticolaceae bacterium]|nr:methylmalonyl-CoA epimerase [Candidatus Polarisedimenticolaceae bacterium]
MIVGIDHIGIAVRNLEERLRFWRDALGLRLAGTESVESEGVRVAFLPAGETRVELLEASRDDSPVAKFIGKRGEGIHHVTFAVASIQPVLDRLKAAGVPLLDETPREGAEGTRVAFLHPAAAGGVLVELVERAGVAARPAGIAPGDAVLLYLRDPQEKIWGVLRERDAAGITIEGMDLASFDAWMSQVERGEDGIVPSLLFFPMSRVERLLLDRGTPSLPALSEGFVRRTGRTVRDVLG